MSYCLSDFSAFDNLSCNTTTTYSIYIRLCFWGKQTIWNRSHSSEFRYRACGLSYSLRDFSAFDNLTCNTTTTYSIYIRLCFWGKQTIWKRLHSSEFRCGACGMSYSLRDFSALDNLINNTTTPGLIYLRFRFLGKQTIWKRLHSSEFRYWACGISYSLYNFIALDNLINNTTISSSIYLRFRFLDNQMIWNQMHSSEFRYEVCGMSYSCQIILDNMSNRRWTRFCPVS
jgi:hypothetical protein